MDLLLAVNFYLSSPKFSVAYLQPTLREQSGKPAARRATGRSAGGGRAAGGSSNILQFYTDDSPGLQVGPTTVLVASLSFVGVVVLLHIWGKFRM